MQATLPPFATASSVFEGGRSPLGAGPLLEAFNTTTGAHTTLLNQANSQILVKQPPAGMSRIVAPSLPFPSSLPITTPEQRAMAIAKAMGSNWMPTETPASVSRLKPDQASHPLVEKFATDSKFENYPYPSSPLSKSIRYPANAPVSGPNGPADWQIPNVQMIVRGQKITLHEALYNRRGLIFGVIGAFTPVCSQRHVPGFRDAMPILREAVECVACVAVNDPYVLKAWATDLDIPKDMVIISDWEGKFTEALGLELDASVYHMGTRCRRFCILIAHGTIVWFGLEDDAFVDKAAVILHRLRLIDDAQLATIQSIAMSLEMESKADPAASNEDRTPTRDPYEPHEDEGVSEERRDRALRQFTEEEDSSEEIVSAPPRSSRRAKGQSSSIDGVQADEEDDLSEDDDEVTEEEM